MTSTLPALWTSAPITGPSMPGMARPMARKFRHIEKAILSFIVVIMRLLRRSRCGSSVISSFTRAMSAASIAMSLPMPPHGYAGVGTLKRGRVVNAVANHAHASLGAVFVYVPYFVLRQALGVYLVYADA